MYGHHSAIGHRYNWCQSLEYALGMFISKEWLTIDTDYKGAVV